MLLYWISLVNVRKKRFFLLPIWHFLDVGIDIQDDLGRHEVGFIDNTFKTPENNGAGCRINASFKINRVPGNFHISTHSAPNQPANGDMKHVIHELIFGDSIKVCIYYFKSKLFDFLGFSTNTKSKSISSIKTF